MHAPFDLDAGTRGFYEDPVYYDHEFKNRTQDVAWYTDRYVEAGDVCLELAVGSARIAAKAVRRGARIVGVDLSAEMLAQAERRRSTLPLKLRDHLELHQADMRDFDLGRTFSLITCPFNAFQHLYTREDVARCLAMVRRHLAPGGRFIVDVLMPDLEYLSRSALRWYAGSRFRHPRHNAWYTYAERSAYDPVLQLNQMWFRLVRDPGEEWGPEEITFQLSHRVFFPQEMEAHLHAAGLRLVEFHGDFQGAPLGKDAESMVVIAELA